MRTFADPRAIPKIAAAISGLVNTESTASIVAENDEFTVIDAIHASYRGGSPAGTLAVAFAGVDKWKVGLDGVGDWEIRFPRGLYAGTKNEEVDVTLGAGGANVFAKVDVMYRGPDPQG